MNAKRNIHSRGFRYQGALCEKKARTTEKHTDELSKDERGSLTVEAFLAIGIFTFFALFVWSLFPIHMAQNAVAHALLQTTESLALDAYAREQMRLAMGGGSPQLNGNVTRYANWEVPSDGSLTTNKVWYRNSQSTEYRDPDPKEVIEVVRKRFEHYLGTNRSESAQDYLAHTFVTGGLEGLDFTGTRVEGKVLYITVSYTYHDLYGLLQAVGSGPLRATQTTCARLWIE